MPELVLLCKSTYVWLDQLSRSYGRPIRTLDAVPDEEFDRLARLGVTGLWLIGLWERSRASRDIKRRRGNPEAVASAYSLYDYGSPPTSAARRRYQDLRDRAWSRGIRLASDMVPNHMGIDSRWVVEHPEWFLRCPSRRSRRTRSTARTCLRRRASAIVLEDHYWDDTDAAVVFKRGGPLDRRRALHLPRQRRHELPVERHGPARLPAGRRPRGRSSRRSSHVARQLPGHPLRRRDGPRQAPHPAAVVPAARERRRDPVAGRARDVQARLRRARCRPSSGARSWIGSRPRRPRRSSSPRRSGSWRATSSGPWACTASTTARSWTCSATRTTPATGG